MRALQLEVQRVRSRRPRLFAFPACIFVCLRVFVLTSCSNVLLELAPSAPRSSRYLLNRRQFRRFLGPPSEEPTGLDHQELLLIFFLKGVVGARVQF